MTSQQIVYHLKAVELTFQMSKEQKLGTNGLATAALTQSVTYGRTVQQYYCTSCAYLINYY